MFGRLLLYVDDEDGVTCLQEPGEVRLVVRVMSGTCLGAYGYRYP